MKQTPRLPRLQFSLRSLLWIMLVVTAFFAGRVSVQHGFRLPARRPPPAPRRLRDTSVGKMNLDAHYQTLAVTIDARVESEQVSMDHCRLFVHS
jgi:hypothetical protein